MARKELFKNNIYIDNKDGTTSLIVIKGDKQYKSILDTIDVNRMRAFRWSVTSTNKRNKTNYLIARPWRSGSSSNWIVMAHGLIMSFPTGGSVVDHIDQNGLNNKRSNLRVVDSWRNSLNKKSSRQSSTGYKGIYKIYYKGKFSGRYNVQIRNKHKLIDLGCFTDIEKAKQVYNDKCKQLRGDFAILNNMK